MKPTIKCSSTRIFSRILVSCVGILAFFLTAGTGFGQTYSVLHTFNGSDGASPVGGLVLSGSVLYGVTFAGGDFGYGTVFKVNTDGTGHTLLHSFGGGPDTGSYPYAPLVLSGGTLFGTTWTGGTYSTFGTVFRIDTNGANFAVLKSFNGTDGYAPLGRLAVLGQKIYGTTQSGGSNFVSANNSGYGTLFTLNTDGSAFSVLRNFMASESNPSGDLVLSDGTLYGVCSSGGKIFAINPDGSGYRSVFVFSGFTVLQSVIISGTKLYGTTFAPGSVFSVNLDGTGFQSLYSFTDGPSQWGGLALFGTTLFGTTWSLDTQNASIFRIGIDGSDFAAIENITNSLIGADLLLSDRTFYGAVDAVGSTNAGFLFSLSLTPPTILASPLTQTVEAGFPVTLGIRATGVPPLSYQWFFNGTNALANATNQALSLTNIQPSQAGYYSVTVTNVGGASTGSPAALSIIPYVPRRMVPFVTVSGDIGSSLSLGFWDSVGGSPNWNPLASFVLTNNSQSYPDLSDPLPPHRFYRTWQSNAASTPPTLTAEMVTAISLSGSVGSNVELDYINRFGPVDAWVKLATFTVTNSSQLFLDSSGIGQPPRLYRVLQLP